MKKIHNNSVIVEIKAYVYKRLVWFGLGLFLLWELKIDPI